MAGYVLREESQGREQYTMAAGTKPRSPEKTVPKLTLLMEQTVLGTYCSEMSM